MSMLHCFYASVWTSHLNTAIVSLMRTWLDEDYMVPFRQEGASVPRHLMLGWGLALDESNAHEAHISPVERYFRVHNSNV